MHSPAEIVDAFRMSGRKITPQRELIFSILHGDLTHPSAEAVHARVVEVMPSVSLRTVYATLHELAALGEVHHLDLGTGAARFDPNTEDHQHFVCTSCGAVRDVHAPDPPLPVADHPALPGCEIDGIQIVLRGRCAPCAGAATPSP